MDAREQLRRYLEQRREAGERELVLDDMDVEEVLRLLGARTGGKPESSSPAQGPVGTRITDKAPKDDPASAVSAVPADWRAALGGGTGSAASPGGGKKGGAPAKAERSPSPPAPRTPPAAADPRGAAPAPSPSEAQGSRSGGEKETHATLPLEQVPSGIVIGSGSRELFVGGEGAFGSLEELTEAVASCTRCELHRTAKNPVPGEGNPEAGLVCVGEAPGATEDETGRPFVGQAGQLLDKILAAIQLSRNDVFICNVLKHRPPGNRNPTPDEVRACSPYLVRQIELIRPRVIVAFGTFAAQTLLDTKEAIGKLRGRIHRYHGVPLVVTYHPAALLRNPGWKRPTWEDVQLARRLLDRSLGS